jgi:hypothetical protein
MPIVGSFAGASARAYGLGAGAIVPGDFVSIQTITAGSAVASIEFTSIPATYTHLQVRGIARFTGATASDNMRLTFNSDSSAVYANHLFFGTGANAVSGNDINLTYSLISTTPGASTSANIFDASVLDILDYSNTNKFKTIRNLTGYDGNGSGYAGLWSALWRSTSVVNSVKLTAGSGNFAQYSSLSLYGVLA